MDDFWNGNYYKKCGRQQELAALRSLKNYPFKGDESILDIGCGSGNISKWIANQVPKGKVVGIDPSKRMLTQAIHDYRTTPNLEFFPMSAEAFHFDRPFDLITSFHALHFSQDHQQAFTRIRSALAPQGKILIRIASRVHPIMCKTFNQEPWRSLCSLEKRLFPLSIDRAKSFLSRFGFIEDHLEVDRNGYLFASLEKVIEWLMTWLPHLSELPEDQTLQLAQELAKQFGKQAKDDQKIEVDIATLVIIAHLP